MRVGAAIFLVTFIMLGIWVLNPKKISHTKNSTQHFVMGEKSRSNYSINHQIKIKKNTKVPPAVEVAVNQGAKLGSQESQVEGAGEFPNYKITASPKGDFSTRLSQQVEDLSYAPLPVKPSSIQKPDDLLIFSNSSRPVSNTSKDGQTPIPSSGNESAPSSQRNSYEIYGDVRPLFGLIVNHSPLSQAFEAYAAANCTNPKIGIYRTEDILKLNQSPLLETPLKQNTKFRFKPTSAINTERPQDYVLQVTGCDSFLARIITAFGSNQSISFSSTLLTYAQVSTLIIKPSDIPSDQLSSIIMNLESKETQYNSINDAYSELNANLAEKFAVSFNGSSPEEITNALPVVREISVPSVFTEGVAVNLTVDAYHWHPAYDLTAEWFVNGVSKGMGLNWNWIPPGNSKSSISIDVRIGKKKPLIDAIDSSLPYHQFSFSRPVINAITPMPPTFVIDTSLATHSATPIIPLKLTTGPEISPNLYDFCSSFTNMALTETPTSPDPANFNLVCSQSMFQDMVHALDISNRSDGPKTLYLWAKDDSDEISSIPNTVTFILDQTPPQIQFEPIDTMYGGGDTFTLSWKVNEASSTPALNFKIEFFNGTSWAVLPAQASINGPLNSQSFSISHVLPNANLDNARYRVSFTDLVGNSTIEVTDTFNIRVPNLLSAPLSVNFGNIAALSSSSTQTITFSNSGEWTTAGCTTPVLTGDSAQFSIIAENCTLNSLSPNGSCTVQVMANPALRQAYNANLVLSCGSLSTFSTLMVTGENNPPVLTATAAQTLNEDTVATFTLTAATDLDGDALTYTVISSPSNGTISNCLAGTNDLSCSYTPNSNYNGTDSFSYYAWDGFNYSNAITVNLTINVINDAPILAATQAAAVDEDISLVFNLNAGSDVENDPLTYILVSSPAHGALTCTGGLSRSCTYVPTANYEGQDTFTYKVNDGSLDSNLATVTITVNSINDAPFAAADFSRSATEDTVHNFSLAIGTDVDIPAQILTYQIVTLPSHGTLSNCIEGAPSTDTTCTYTPDANYNGADSLVYRVCDPITCSLGTTTVSITVSPVNDPPVMVANQTFALDDIQYVDFTLSGATDIDIPAQTISYKINSALAQGSLTGCITSGSWMTSTSCRFTPPLNFQGSLSFTYQANDTILTSVSSSTVTFNISDKTPSPTPVATLATPYYTKDLLVGVTNSSCTDINSLKLSINATAPLATDSGWVGCTTAAGAVTTSLSTTNGLQTLYLWSKDQYGNVQPTPATVDVIFDNIAPAITIDNNNVLGNQTKQISFVVTEVNITAGQNFFVEYHNGTSWTSWNVSAANGPLLNASFNTNIAVPNSSNTLLTLKVTYTDLAGNQTISSTQFRNDLALPIVDLLSLNGGSPTSANNNILVRLNAHDTISTVRAFCLKYNNSTPPAANASCWKDVNAPIPGITPAQSITFNNYYFQIGFVKGSYTIYAWVKDDAGLISQNIDSSGVDKYSIYFDPGTPPAIANIQAANSNTPNSPADSTDLSVSSGQNIYVKWHATDIEGLAPTPITVEYTTNDVDFLSFPASAGNNLSNSANGACTFDASFTGCVVLSAPVSSYFKVRVIAKDNVATTVFLSPAPFNDSKLSILAGNTEHGLGGSALAAIFYGYGSSPQISYLYKHNLVISEDGKIFYLDRVRGLLWVDPSTGVLNTFINTTGTTSGDGGLATAATLRSASAIVLDPSNNLLIWDHNRLRKVNLSTMVITHVLGGGALVNPQVTVNANDIALGSVDRIYTTIIPLPNGDIIFPSRPDTTTHSRYRAADNKIEPIVLTGDGLAGNPSETWSGKRPLDLAVVYDTTTSNIQFMAKAFYKTFTGDGYPIFSRIDHTAGNETTPYPSITPQDLSVIGVGGVVTGLDGKLYFVDRFRRNLFLYDHTTNTKTNILGNGAGSFGPCPDDTLATACPVDLDTIFVSKNSRIYFFDRGILRTIDDNNKVISLFGQFPSFGNGSLATIARFGNIVDINLDKTDAFMNKILVQDGYNSELRNFTIGSNLNMLSNISYSSNGPFSFEVDPSTGDVFSPNGVAIRRFVRATSTWTTVVGGGTNDYFNPASDGLPGSSIRFTSYPRILSGYANNRIFYSRNHWNGSSYIACMTKSYNVSSSYMQEHFIGDGSCGSLLSDGGVLGDQIFGPSNIEYFQDPNDSVSKYFLNNAGSTKIYTATQGGTINLFADLGFGMRSFTHQLSGGLKIYFCSGGSLYQYTHATQDTVVLPWQSPSIKCKATQQQSILFNSTRNSIIFSFTQNGLDGVGEYKLP